MRNKTAFGLAGVAAVAALGLSLVTPGAHASGSTTTLEQRGSTVASTQYTAGRVTNKWFPLKPGTRMVYRGVDEGERAVDVLHVTHRTRTIQGVLCRVVHDRLMISGILAEKTTDFYAQSLHGDVWYFGERTALYDEQGNVTSREGSWLAGRDGAKAGIYITAHPRVGQTRRQEYYAGHAEDHFKVIGVSERVRVPLLLSTSAVLTKEWTPLEPNILDHKYYVRDIGVVSEETVQGPTELLKLASVSHLG